MNAKTNAEMVHPLYIVQPLGVGTDDQHELYDLAAMEAYKQGYVGEVAVYKRCNTAPCKPHKLVWTVDKEVSPKPNRRECSDIVTKKRWTDEETLRMVELSDKGTGNREIGRVLGRSAHAISCRLSKWNEEGQA